LSKSGPAIPFYRDRPFWLALLAGPLAWLALYAWSPVTVQWDKPWQHPEWFLQLALLYPLLEEIAFRGLLQELLRDGLPRASCGPLTAANLLTSVLFSAAHFFYHPPLAAALVFFPSLVFGYFKERSGGLPAPVILHAFYNAGYLWLFAIPG
jgi:membrane protease YdiL (CAAX protease family)